MPIIQRYSNIKKGGIVFVGNTLGLSKFSNANTAGVLGSIGAFISLDQSLRVNDFPFGTTLDYTKNGSQALLSLPVGSSVIYAELVWGGLYRSSARDISSLLGNSVAFRTPQGAYSIQPDAATSQNFTIQNGTQTLGFYVRSANVTPLVAAALNGTYAAGQIPALIEAIDASSSDTNHAGWTLAVVYENASHPLRNLTLWGGGTVVSLTAGSTDVSLTGFKTPSSLPITGKLFVSAQEGDAVIAGDRMYFGRTTSGLFPLSGPNNPVGNFFASQINRSDGTLDTSGTFGTRNAVASSGVNTVACRQGWDVTAIDVSSLLAVDQTTAVVRLTTDGDLYVVNTLGLQVDSNGAQIDVTKSADKTIASVGEEIRYKIRLFNSGNLRAETVSLSDSLPAGGTLVAGSVTVDGVPYAGNWPIVFQYFEPGKSVTVEYVVRFDTLPSQNPASNVARADYMFLPFPDYPVSTFTQSAPVSVFLVDPRFSINKSVDKGYAAAGEELTYSSAVTNLGNLTATNVVFKDAAPPGTVFVAGSVKVDGVSYPEYDPAAGFALPDLSAGQSAAVIFKVKIMQTGENIMIIENRSDVTFKYVLPDQSTISGEQNSNPVQTEVLTYAVGRVKSSDKAFLNEGENALQTVVVTNNSAATLRSVFFKDVMSAGASHIAGSVTENGVSQPAYDPVAGFALADIPSGGSTTVQYGITANDPKTNNEVTNGAMLTYSVDDPVRGPVTYTEPTNEISLALISTRMTVEKSVDKGYAVKGDLLHYTSVITNTGSLNKTSLVFSDPIPAGTTFENGTVTIDGVSYPSYDPAAGFPLKDLAPGESVSVGFDVRVN